ncbi:MAG TPA: hypothetical protein VGM13_04620 [Thermoanaerobaculia bacterium]|jgi:hypothetical protein
MGALVPFVWRRPLPRLERERRIAERRDRPIMLICGGSRYGSDPEEEREPPRLSRPADTSFPWYGDQSPPEGDGCG